MDITKMSLVELKALAYDQLAIIENAQKNIQAINQQMQKLSQIEPKGEIVNEEPKPE